MSSVVEVSAVIRVAGKDRQRAVHLLQGEDAHKPMRQGGGSERQGQFGTRPDGRVQTISAPNREDKG